MARHERDSQELRAEGLIVTADLRDLEGYNIRAPQFDYVQIVLVHQVTPDRITGMERVPVSLPPRGGLLDWMGRRGFGQRQDDGWGRKTIEMAKQLGYPMTILGGSG
jgi:hypothetical protein